MAISFSRVQIWRRRPYQSYKRRRGTLRLATRPVRVGLYRPWGIREAFMYPFPTIPGYWVRGIGPRYKIGSYNRCFNPGHYSRF